MTPLARVRNVMDGPVCFYLDTVVGIKHVLHSVYMYQANMHIDFFVNIVGLNIGFIGILWNDFFEPPINFLSTRYMGFR